MLVLSICVIFCSQAFQYLCYKKVFLDENPKTWFLDMKKLQKATKVLKCPPKKIPKWFSTNIIHPICFMKLLWSISAHWCFQKLLGPDWLCGGLMHLNILWHNCLQLLSSDTGIGRGQCCFSSWGENTSWQSGRKIFF